jgi:type III pantothenate kinase
VDLRRAEGRGRRVESKMLLAIDVGNTNIVFGVFEGELLVESWRLATLRERTSDEIGIWVAQLFEHRALDANKVTGIVMGSVVPPLTGTFITMAQRYFGIRPLNVDSSVDTGLAILYKNPSEVGADRLLNGVAGYNLYGRERHAPMVIVDFGTATTFDAISAKGEYLGGVITPGLQISADALFQRAARLPRVDLKKPCEVIGTTTVGAIESGLYYGYAALVDGLVKRMARQLGPNTVCIATGGLASIIAPEVEMIELVDPDLTLQGLRMVWERNRPR